MCGAEIKDTLLGIINIESENIHEKIINQQGLFLFLTNINHSFAENCGISEIPHQKQNSTLEQLSSRDDDIIRFIVPYDLKEKILRSLYKMNVNARVLFLDLDSFARSIQLTMMGP